MIKLFFSYTHKDEELRNELDKHLSALRRQGVIDAWHDRCIIGGSEIDSQISHHLKAAQIILLLVSADFLASDYCYDKEMKFAMERHKNGEAVVLPVILRPCDWHNTPFGKLLAMPKDGKAVVKHSTLDDAFLEITKEIKRIVKSFSASVTEGDFQATSPPSQSDLSIRSSNLRVKKTFSDHERDKFLDDAFEYLSKYFEGSLVELQKRNKGVEQRFKRIDSQTFTASVYIDGKVRSECTIFYGGNSFYGRTKSINFVYGITNAKNSLNEAVSIADDGYQLYLAKLGVSLGRQNNDKMTFEGAAEYYWEMFIKRLQE